MIVTATNGTPALYEIISGPVTMPFQESNIFEPIPAGTYVIRVEFYLLTQNAAILGNQPADIYTITYHFSQGDADNDVNSIGKAYFVIYFFSR